MSLEAVSASMFLDSRKLTTVAVVGEGAAGRIDGGLAVLRADDDEGRIVETPCFQGGYYPLDSLVNGVEALDEVPRRRPRRVRIAARDAFLPDAHGLEVHAHDGGHRGLRLALVVESLYLVDEGIDFYAVVGDGVDDGLGEIVAVLVARHWRVDLGSEELIDARTGGPVHYIVGRVLVRPVGALPRCLDHLKDGIYLQVIVRVYGLEGRRGDGETEGSMAEAPMNFSGSTAESPNFP